MALAIEQSKESSWADHDKYTELYRRFQVPDKYILNMTVSRSRSTG